MAKIKIYFKGQEFEIEESLLAETVAMLKARLAAISGGAVNPDEPGEPDTPDTPVEPDEPVVPDEPVLTALEPGLYTHGAIELAEGGDIVTASSKKIMTWDEAVDANIIEVVGTAVATTDYDYFGDFDENVGIDIVVPEGITAIGTTDYFGEPGFSGRHTIKGVKLPSSIQRLEDYAFGSSAIEILVFESNSNLEYIGQEAIYQTELRLITLPTTVSVIKFRGLGGNSWMQVAYEGTIEQFNQITKSPGWYCWGVPEYIICSDGNYYPTEYDTTEDPEYVPTFCLNIYDWETKEWLTDFLGIPEGISWQELENEYYYVTCESDVVTGTFGPDGIEGWIVYSDGAYVHPYDEISTSDETYYVTQVSPDTPDAPNQNTFSVCITYPEYDPSDDRYWTYIEGVTEGMTWRQLTEVNDTLIIEDSEVRNNNAQTVCDDNNNIVDPDDVIIKGHTYHVIG